MVTILFFYLLQLAWSDHSVDITNLKCHDLYSEFDSAIGQQAAEQAIYYLTHTSSESIFLDPANALDFGSNPLFVKAKRTVFLYNETSRPIKVRPSVTDTVQFDIRPAKPKTIQPQ
jgi:hypothetical protein